jgi:hypothetical protein
VALTLARGIMASTFEQFRCCGQGHDECVVYWTGPRDIPGAVDGFVLPGHQAGPDWYETDPAWVTSFFLELRRDGRMARAQVHTHPALAGHSHVDDDHALVARPDFHSLVIPHFAAGPVGLDDAYLAIVTPDGAWAKCNASNEIREAA